MDYLGTWHRMNMALLIKSGPANIKLVFWPQLLSNPSPSSLFPRNADWKEKKMSYRQKERKE